MREDKTTFWHERFDAFSISGKDARKFLNGTTTGNIINSNDKISKTCWLSPNGVLRSILEIIFLEKKLEVVILGGNTKQILDYFNNIIFPADNVFLSQPYSINRFQKVDDINSWRNSQPIFFKNEDHKFQTYKNDRNILNSNDLKLWKINQAIPSLENEINGKNNPMELGLTDLIDFNKGCFLGQETMSKIKNVSSLKQEIRVWESLDSDINDESKNTNIYANFKKENVVGKISSFHQLDYKIRGLAIIKKRYLTIGNSFYSEMFGKIKVKKSIGSIFL